MKLKCKKVLITSLVFPIFLFSADNINYCKIDLADKIYKSENNKNLVLNLGESNIELEVYLKELELKPYNYNALEKSLDLIFQNYDSMKNSKNIKRSIVYDKNVMNIIYNALIFTDIKNIKKYEYKILEVFNDPYILKNLSNPSYFNYLVLYKIGFFKYKEQEIEFLKNIKPSVKDLPYQFLVSNIFKYNPDVTLELTPKILKYLNQRKDFYLKQCFSDKNIKSLNKKIELTDLLEIVTMIQLFNDKSLIEVYYNLNNGSSLLKYINVYSNFIDKNYTESYEILKTIYEYENKPEYMKPDLLNIAYLASDKAFMLNDYYKSRYLSIEGLYIYKDMTQKTKEDKKISFALKNNLKKSSEIIINKSLSDNNINNSNFLINETKKLLTIE